jgi:hypothetical protein
MRKLPPSAKPSPETDRVRLPVKKILVARRDRYGKMEDAVAGQKIMYGILTPE